MTSIRSPLPFATLPPAVLDPCARPGASGDWWEEQHKMCTSTQHIMQGGIRFFQECACECHSRNVKKIDETSAPANEEKT